MHFLSVTTAGRDVTVVACEYTFGTAQPARHGYEPNIGKPPPYSGIDPLRITMKAPLSQDQNPPAGTGPLTVRRRLQRLADHQPSRRLLRPVRSRGRMAERQRRQKRLPRQSSPTPRPPTRRRISPHRLSHAAALSGMASPERGIVMSCLGFEGSMLRSPWVLSRPGFTFKPPNSTRFLARGSAPWRFSISNRPQQS